MSVRKAADAVQGVSGLWVSHWSSTHRHTVRTRSQAASCDDAACIPGAPGVFGRWTAGSGHRDEDDVAEVMAVVPAARRHRAGRAEEAGAGAGCPDPAEDRDTHFFTQKNNAEKQGHP